MIILSQIKISHGELPPSFQSSHLTTLQKDSIPLPSSQPPPFPPPPPPPSSSRISPAVLFIIVILAVIFFISGLLHLLVRFLLKKSPSSSSSSRSNRHSGGETPGSDTLQRQLQQLFHLHDSGLDQAFIDALPVFLYREIVGSKEPFDCAVCLCEFSSDDKLRLLPVCGHAFHLNCIDTWLLSNSTCPLCRGTLFVPGLAIENPIFDFEDSRDEEGVSADRGDGFSITNQKQAEVFPVRLGKFRRLSNGDSDGSGDGNGECGNVNGSVRREEGESSSSNLDARRCYSMGSYQYVVGDANLRVALRNRSGMKGRGRGMVGNSIADEGGVEGKRIGSKGESFSVSKIWLWSNKKEKLPVSSSDDASSWDRGLPWMRRSTGDS